MLARVALRFGDPEPVPDVVAVVEVDRRPPRGDRREDRRARPGRILVEADNRRGIDPGRPQQPVPVLARALERSFVREHAGPRPEGLESQPAEEAALGPFRVGAGHAVRLLVDVDRGTRILVKRPIGAPGGQGSRRTAVPIVGLVPGLHAWQVEAHDVLRVAGKKARRLLGADDVVRRRNNRGEVANRLGVVAQRTERTDFGHGLPQASAIGGGHGRPRRTNHWPGPTNGWHPGNHCRMAIVR